MNGWRLTGCDWVLLVIVIALIAAFLLGALGGIR